MATGVTAYFEFNFAPDGISVVYNFNVLSLPFQSVNAMNPFADRLPVPSDVGVNGTLGVVLVTTIVSGSSVVVYPTATVDALGNLVLTFASAPPAPGPYVQFAVNGSFYF